MTTVQLQHGVIDDRRDGPNDGSPVVFIHGALVNGSLWHQTAARLAAAGYRTFVPDLPLGSHRHPFDEAADLSPTGVADVLAQYLAAVDVKHATLVANDTGGAITQFLLTRDPSRVGRVVFTNCDTFERFPPPPFDRMFKMARSPAVNKVLLQPMRSTRIRHRAGFGSLVAKPLDADQTWDWIEPALTDAGVRRDFAKLAKGIEPAELVANAELLRRFRGPVLVAWAPEDRIFRIADGRRLAACFDDARVVEIPDSRTFVAHDQPERLADEIASFVAATAANGGAQRAS